MSFCGLLSNYVHQKDIQVASMAQYCHTDRSTMYKFLNGKRNPASRQQVERMADFMELTPFETKKLLEEYRAASMGTDKYYGRKNIIDFLREYPCDISHAGDLPLLSGGEAGPGKDSTVFTCLTDRDIPLQNKTDIQQAVYQMLVRESLLPKGLIRIIAQPSWVYLFDLLQSLSTHGESLEIRHITCMNNSNHRDFQNKDCNIAGLHPILSVFQSGAAYRPRYYYDNVDSHFNDLSLFPYLILTSEYALACSWDIQTGILYQGAEMLEMFGTLFERQYKAASVFFNSVPSVLEYMNILQSQLHMGGLACHLSACPCLISLADEYLYNKYVADIPERERIVGSLTDYSAFLDRQQRQGKLQTCFTMKGLESFLETGRVQEIPSSFYRPILEEDFRRLVQKLYDKAAAGYVQLLTGALENLSPYIECLFTPENGMIITTGRNYRVNYLILDECHLITSFIDCFTHLKEMELVASREETLSKLGELLNTL